VPFTNGCASYGQNRRSSKGLQLLPNGLPAVTEHEMRFTDYSHRHGKQLLQVLHPAILSEIESILTETPPFPHGAQKGRTVKNHLTEAFAARGWQTEGIADFSTEKRDALDLSKRKIALEMEFSRFEMFS
jgi:hypothetical protein